MKILWATDIHLNFAGEKELNRFCDEINLADALIISGDITGGRKADLELLSEKISVPIYFVLGNHDYYGCSFSEMNGIVGRLCNKKDNLRWLSRASGGYELLNGVPIVGHEGWYDCHFGMPGRLVLNDFMQIKDFRPLYLTGVESLLFEKFREKAKQAADHFRSALSRVFQQYDKAILVTHVPPFKEAAWHQGQMSDKIWLPYMSSKIAGDALIDIMNSNQDKKLLVLCGHTHSEGQVQMLPNLKVLTGKAVYRFPEISKDLGDLSNVF